MNLEAILWWLDLLILVVGGLIALGTIVTWAVRRRDPLRGAPLRPNRIGAVSVWLCVTAYFLGGTVGGALGAQLAPADADKESRQLWTGIMGANIGAAISIVVCLAVARYGFPGGWRGFGLGRRPLWRDAAAAVPAALASMSVCTALAWTTQKVIQLFHPAFRPPLHSVFTTLEDATMPTAMKVLAFVGALLVAPFSEELLFRGILQTAARRLFPAGRGRLHRWGAIALVGVLFGAMHGLTPHHVPALIVFGVILGYLYERSGSLTLPILVHFLFNGKSLLWDALLNRM